MGGRKLITSSKDVILEVGLLANFEGIPTQCEQLDQITYDVVWANGAGNTANIVVQKSNDGISWIDLYSLLTIDMNVASGNHQIDVKIPNCKFIRPKIIVAAGALDVTVSVKGTTMGA